MSETDQGRLTTEGVTVHARVVSARDARAMLRVLWQDFCERGVSADELRVWRETACPFPHLRTHPLVKHMGDLVTAAVGAQGTPCEPQFIWHLPQSDYYQAPPMHLDQEPPWANGRRYERIAGLALTPWHASNGTLVVWRQNSHWPAIVQLQPGDVVAMHPLLTHASGVNHGTEIRAGIYYRWLQE